VPRFVTTIVSRYAFGPWYWPLIRFFMDDPVYRAAYRAHVEDLLNTALEPGRVTAILQRSSAPTV